MIRILTVSTCALLAVTNIGCVLDPINGGDFSNGSTRVHGYFPQPNADIYVQALNVQTNLWETIASTRSSGFGIRTGFTPFPGSDAFYYWDAGTVEVPKHLWVIPEHSESIRKMCSLRAITANGQVLPSYNKRPDIFGDPIEEWRENGNQNNMITLYDFYDF